jgi:hypothetical protein
VGQTLRGTLEDVYEASECEDECINADVPARVTARKTAAVVDTAVQQTVIDHPAAPHHPAESGIALPA